MTRFLIVDDSLLARQIIRDLLKKSFECEVVEATDGLDAVQSLEEQGPFDLILSDLQMPRLDGLGLLAVVRDRFRCTPFVILTAFGNEDIAVQAIQEGAASYVPKQSIRGRLSDVVKTVLTAATRRQIRKRLTRHIVAHELEFSLINDRRLLSAAVAELQEIGQSSGTFEEHQLTRIGVSLEESLLNAMIHGNLEISSELRDREDDAYEQLILARQETLPYCNRRIHLKARFTPDEVRFVITDEGPGFDLAAVPDPRDPQNFLKPSGRGLLLIRSFMDEAYHNTSGNSITLVKRSHPRPAEAESPAGRVPSSYPNGGSSPPEVGKP
ncbi:MULTISPECIES: response regulator [unclassified Schlesneria]|uniref:response regulator n=1 Tax=Schlesneria TaxID=656899 RepID=UPI0035A0C9AC